MTDSLMTAGRVEMFCFSSSIGVQRITTFVTSPHPRVAHPGAFSLLHFWVVRPSILSMISGVVGLEHGLWIDTQSFGIEILVVGFQKRRGFFGLCMMNIGLCIYWWLLS
jgi:hypothetical protein